MFCFELRLKFSWCRIWEAVLNQAVQSATWTIKALHTTKEPDPRAGSSYRNALAARPRPMLQQRAAACTSWLPTIVETLWKEVSFSLAAQEMQIGLVLPPMPNSQIGLHMLPRENHQSPKCTF